LHQRRGNPLFLALHSDELFLVLESDAEFVFSGELFLWDAAKPLE
jgi:hypothetical protein